MKAEITKIKIQLKEREIELTAQEARQLKEELSKLFDLEKSAIEKLKEEWDRQNAKKEKEYIPYPYPVYPAPIIIDRTVPQWPNHWQIWCGGNTGTPVMPNGGTLCMAVGSAT